MLAKRLILAVVSLPVVAGAAHAATSTVTDSSPLVRTSRFEAGIFTGFLAGTAREYAYDEGYKASQLNWHIDNAVTAGFNLAYRPMKGLVLRGEAWTVAQSNGTLADYDWPYHNTGTNPWGTDWITRSIGPLRRMDRTYGADFDVAASFYRFGGLSLDALAGVRYLTMTFNAHDSSYINFYSDPNDPKQFHRQEGVFPGTNVIYKQTWYSGYLGLAMRYGVGRFGFHAQVVASPWAYGEGRDDHVARATIFRERGERSTMFGMQAGIDYQLAPHWTLFSSLAYEKYSQAQADMRVINADGHITAFPAGAAGLSNETWSLRAGARFVF